MKRCTLCQTRLPLAAFPRNRRAPDGLSWRCRPCVAAYQAQWRVWRRAEAEPRVAMPVATRRRRDKLLALAGNPGATPAEAALAQRRAQALQPEGLQHTRMTARERLRRAGLVR